MIRLSFEIEHRGCWACALTTHLPDVTMVMRSAFPRAGGARYIMTLRLASPGDMDAAMSFLSGRPDIGALTLAEVRTESATFVLDGPWEGSVTGTIMEKGGFLLAPTLVERGAELYQVGLARAADAAPILEAVERLGHVRSHHVARDTFADLRLTENQKRALRAAIAGGYYAYPRETSPTQLAEELGLAKSTLVEHLQKAEAKIILSHEEMI